MDPAASRHPGKGRTRARLHLAALVALLASASLAGCIQGTFAPAEVPRGSLASGWRLDSGESTTGEEGVDPIVVARYQVNKYVREAPPIGVLYVISVSDVPVVDEQSVITDELEQRLEAEQFDRRQTYAGTGAIKGHTASYTLSDASARILGVPVQGRAIEAQFTCQPSGMAVRVLGFGSDAGGPAAWAGLVGQDPRSALGGMVAEVQCVAG